MAKKIRIGCAPLGRNIYAGTLSKDGRRWLNDRTDVTNEAIGAVIEHIGAGHILTVDLHGVPAFEIEVRSLAQAEAPSTSAGGKTDA